MRAIHAAAVPKAVGDHFSWDLGIIESGRELGHTFIIRNAGHLCRGRKLLRRLRRQFGRSGRRATGTRGRRFRAVAEMRSAEQFDAALALKPDHAYAKGLAEQVRTRLMDARRSSWPRMAMTKRCICWSRSPPHLRSPRSQEIYRQAAELAFLAWDLRNAPVVDATLIAVSGRLRKLATDDARAVKLCDEVERRAKLAKNGGVLSRVSQLMRSGGPQVAWGLDLGISGLKAVRLSWNESKRQAIIEAAALVEHAKPLSYAVNEAEEHRLVADTLKKFLENHQTKGRRVCVGLPGRLALGRQFDLPPVDAAKAPRLVEFEAQQQFPFPLEQLAWDYQFFDEVAPGPSGTPKPSGDLSAPALLVGAQQTTARRFLKAFRRLDIRVNVLQTDFVALHNFLAHEYFAAPGEQPPGEACGVAAALDIGCDVTNIVVSAPQSLWFHSCGVAGQSFTRALVREFKFSMAQAEQRKRRPESAERLSDLYEVMSPVFWPECHGNCECLRDRNLGKGWTRGLN